MLEYFITYLCISCENKQNILAEKTDINESPQMFMRRTLKDTMYGTVPVMACPVCCVNGYSKHEAIAVQAFGDEQELHNLQPINPAL